MKKGAYLHRKIRDGINRHTLRLVLGFLNRCWKSIPCLIFFNFILLILTRCLNWIDTFGPVYENDPEVVDELLPFNATVDAAMEIFQYMQDTRSGKVGPKPLDFNAQAIKTHWCWVYPGRPHNWKWHNRDWQVVEDAYPAEIYLYAAYYDKRFTQLYPMAMFLVQVLAMVRRSLRGPVYCQLWFNKDPRPYVVTAFKREIWQRAWDPRNRFYGPWLITCPVGEHGNPTHVSITTRACTPARNFLPVRNNHPPDDEEEDAVGNKVAVCVKGMDYLEDNSRRMVEWMELQLMLGADRIVFYTYSVHPKTLQVISFYNKTGKALQVPLTLPGRAPNSPHQRSRFIWRNRQQKRRNEIVPYNDCLYRHLYSHRYILIIDMDEAIVPRAPLKTWSQLLQKVNEDNQYMAYSIRNAFLFDNLTTTVNESIPSYMHMLRHNVRSAKLSEPGSYGKSFVMTQNVATVFNHFPLHKTQPGFHRTHYVDPKLALKLHYKAVCPIESRDECPGLYNRTVTDNSLEPFTDQLIKNVQRVLRKLDLLT